MRDEETIEPFDPGPNVRGRNVKIGDSRESIVHEVNPRTNPAFDKRVMGSHWSLGWAMCGITLGMKLCPTWTSEPVNCVECLAAPPGGSYLSRG